jgi:HD-like signal output (HDOD) protein
VNHVPASVSTAVLSLRDIEVMPEVLARIWLVSEDPALGAGELSDVVGIDPGLTAAVLHAANGAHYGFRRQVTSLREACTLLGVRAVRSLTLTLLIRNGLLPRRHAPFQFHRVEFWRHSVAAAFASEALARRLRWSHPEMAYAAGLLHDVGIMVLDRMMPRELGRILELMRQGRTVQDADREVLGCSHADVGRLVAEMWCFPRAVTVGIALHHRPFDADPEMRRLACLITLADFLASPSGPVCWQAEPDGTRGDVIKFLALEEGALVIARSEMEGRLRTASQLLELEEGPPARG